MKNKKIFIYSLIIILSILSIIGISFGFYMMRINGNTNTKSVEVTAVDKKVNFVDHAAEGTNYLSLGKEYSKTFDVYNISNEDGLVTYHIYLDNVSNNFIRKQDITYTLYRGTPGGSEEIIATGVFPSVNSYLAVNETLYDKSDERATGWHNYTLKIKYNLSNTEKQDDDQGHSINYKIQIHGEIKNPFTSGTLAYKILDSAINSDNTNGSALFRTKSTDKTDEASLISTVDDYGVSYYYRGAVKNNYVNFAGMCFRIVRIEGDGAVKLILEDNNATCNSSAYTGNWRISDLLQNTYQDTLSSFLSSSLVSSFKSWQTSLNTYINSGKLKNDEWCFDNYLRNSWEEDFSPDSDGSGMYTTAKYYGKLNNTFICLGSKYTKYSDNSKSYVATLTDDEIILGKGNASKSYFINDTFDSHWWSMSLNDWQWNVGYTYNLLYENSIASWNSGESNVRPVITLVKNIRPTSGDGTKNNPYQIN